MKTSIRHTIRHALLGSALTFALAAPALADGGSSAPPATPSLPELTPQEEAIQLYNEGLKARDKAWALEEEHLAKPSDKLAQKIEKQFEKAAAKFREAVSKNPLFHQAHGSLGYALRRLGDFEGSLASYDTALELAPDYAEAIEYRAEAYLALNRIEEAKDAYMSLFRTDRERAKLLYEAMESWLATRQSDRGDLDQETVDDFAVWLEERGRVSDTTALLYSADALSW